MKARAWPERQGCVRRGPPYENHGSPTRDTCYQCDDWIELVTELKRGVCVGCRDSYENNYEPLTAEEEQYENSPQESPLPKRDDLLRINRKTIWGNS